MGIENICKMYAIFFVIGAACLFTSCRSSHIPLGYYLSLIVQCRWYNQVILGCLNGVEEEVWEDLAFNAL